MRDTASECLHADADPCGCLTLTDSGPANILHHPHAFTPSDAHAFSDTDTDTSPDV
jgi:hypothetical protein